MNATKMARNFVGVILMLAGLGLAIYAGLWWAFIGGIVQIVEAVKADPIIAMDIALGLARVVCAGFIGVVTGVVAIFPGFAMLKA